MESVSAPGNSEEENKSTPVDPVEIDVAIENDDNNNDVGLVEEALEVLRLEENSFVQEQGSNEDLGKNEPDINNGDDLIRAVDVDDDGDGKIYNKNADCSLEVEEPYPSQEFAELSSQKEVSEEKDGKDEEVLEPEKGSVDEGAEVKEFSELPERLEEEISEQEDNEIEAASSPSSSGYAGGRGSSSPASVGSGSGTDEIKLGGETGFYDNGNGARPMKAASKRNINEDESSISWRKRKKHFFILSNSGKPIYSRYGDEYKLAGFSATLQAIISFVENGGDHIRLVCAGNYQIIFLVKGPIYLVCISCTEEPFRALKGQLELLYGQMLLILTKSIDKCFEKNSKFDLTPLLGGTDAVFASLVHAFSCNPATYLHAYMCLPLPYSTRQAAGAILQDVADSGVLFAVLMCGHKVISLVGAQKAVLHPDDMLLLSNFVSSSESFRTTESFSPICLPKYNAMAFLYAYVQYLEVDTYLVLLTTSSDAFFHLKECRIRIENVLVKSQVLSEIQRSVLDGGLHVEDLPGENTVPMRSTSSRAEQDMVGSSTGIERRNIGIGGPAGLWHFMYRSNYLDQYVASEYPPPLNNRNAQKRLFRAYQNLYASMHDRDIGPHKMQYRKDENYVLLCWITQDFELYAAFDPLAEKSSAITVCNRVCQWLRDVESEIFLLGAGSFSW
ncbi:vacuolar fusion protein MON1 homolog isoform X1 [Cryptomeria japonica]|uniref:vacuolar fusion protein MON1 homolog isoform X1 n=1 Tax=Cryptomeria japonica TaxID=3369 RepID=UPI0027DAB51C|nr:vacuolar fusion protein MON1 homolog isoform X1 [Cryptomeria japonica]